MRGKRKRQLILKKILAYALVLTMVLGIWTSVSNAADNSVSSQTVGENTVEETQQLTDDADAVVDSSKDAGQNEENNVQSDTNQSQDTQKESSDQQEVKTQTGEETKVQVEEAQEDEQKEELSLEDEEETTAEAVPVTLASTGNTTPAHRKYIKYNGEDSYTLTLDVTGKYDSSRLIPKVDVVLVIDISGSMGNKMGAQTRLETLKEVVTKKNGLSDSILNNDKIEGRMTVVTYAGSKDSGKHDAKWDDANWLNSKSWSSSKAELDNVVNRIRINDNKKGTNCQAGIRTAKEALASADSDAAKILIFLSDGLPTYRYDSDGYTVGTGNSDPGNKNADAAYAEASTITGLNQFYTIGFSNSADSTFLSTLVKKVKGTTTSKYYSAADANSLSEAFQAISGNLTEYTCRNVTITDTLSDYAQLEDEAHFNPIVRAVASDGSEVDLSAVNISVSYNAQNRTITATFPEDYTLEQDVTYSISFNVKPTAQAYDEYAENENGYGGIIGSANSDAPDNYTSSNKPGFYTNNSATLTYTYGTEEAEPEDVDYVEKPVLQVDSLTIPVNKVWENTEASEQVPVTVELYQDGKLTPYKTLVLNADNQWQAEFQYVAKHHQYQIKEQTLDGFVSAVTGDVTTGFTVTNTKLPSLTLSKEVTGEMGDLTKKFPFRITLTDASGNPIEGTYSYRGFVVEDVKNVTAPKDGTLTFEQGTAEIWLSHEQGIELEQLSLGTTYNITEKLDEAEGYRVSFNGIHKDSANGVLSEDAEVSVVNARETIPVTNVSALGTSMISGILLATVALFVLAAISKLFYGNKDKKQDK